MDVLDLLGCEKPILQAGMADISRSKLASAVSLAGGIGTIGLSPPPQFEVDILDTKEEVGKRSFAVNLLMPFITQTHMDICIRTFCLLVLDVNSKTGQNNPPLQREVFDLKNQLQILKQQQSAFMQDVQKKIENKKPLTVRDDNKDALNKFKKMLD